MIPIEVCCSKCGKFDIFSFANLVEEAKNVDKVETLNELFRTYYFPGGDKVTLSHVIELIVEPTGVHKLKTRLPDGRIKQHIISAGWIHITIEANDWTA
jgi:heterodisulfide reductase subunit B